MEGTTPLQQVEAGLAKLEEERVRMEALRQELLRKYGA